MPELDYARYGKSLAMARFSQSVEGAMLAIILCVRKPGKLEIDFFMPFTVPEIPRVGEYISVTKLDVQQPLSEDYVVRKIWWRLQHGGDTDTAGSLIEIFVECDIACGPYATREWQQVVAIARERGVEVENFEVARITVGLGNDMSDGQP